MAQREHYLPGSVTVHASRWWRSSTANKGLFALGVAAAVASVLVPEAAVVSAGVVAAGPLGLSLKGRTSPLSWTRRLATAALVSGVVVAAVVGDAGTLGGVRAAVVAAGISGVLAPVVLDAVLLALRPVEDALAGRFVRRAGRVLAEVRPVVVGVTGSFGKTSTKAYLAHLLSPEHAVCASPKSFNNRAGLARTVNELCVPGTEVLVAEMGAYGPGEIAAICRWMHPEISVITAIGPAHLERFGTLERTLAAKAEIAKGARVVVVNADDEMLSGLASTLQATATVRRVSGTDSAADVAVLEEDGGLALFVAGERIGPTPPRQGASGQSSASTPDERGATDAVPSNVACAVAAALELGVSATELVAKLSSLPVVANRLQRYEAAGGYVVLDDTYNSNPAGARRALRALRAEATTGRRVLVTPGMVELGSSQQDENAAFAEDAGQFVSDLVVVGRTNRSALRRGAASSGKGAKVLEVATREEAVSWARAELGPGDAVLFENDLPDHFP